MKEFQCKQECESNCCSFTVVKLKMKWNEKVDMEYLQLHELEFRDGFLKIPIKCKWLKNNKCINYENRPYVCKVSDGSAGPFKIEGCPY